MFLLEISISLKAGKRFLSLVKRTNNSILKYKVNSGLPFFELGCFFAWSSFCSIKQRRFLWVRCYFIMLLVSSIFSGNFPSKKENKNDKNKLDVVFKGLFAGKKYRPGNKIVQMKLLRHAQRKVCLGQSFRAEL